MGLNELLFEVKSLKEDEKRLREELFEKCKENAYEFADWIIGEILPVSNLVYEIRSTLGFQKYSQKFTLYDNAIVCFYGGRLDHFKDKTGDLHYPTSRDHIVNNFWKMKRFNGFSAKEFDSEVETLEGWNALKKKISDSLQNVINRVESEAADEIEKVKPICDELRAKLETSTTVVRNDDNTVTVKIGDKTYKGTLMDSSLACMRDIARSTIRYM